MLSYPFSIGEFGQDAYPIIGHPQYMCNDELVKVCDEVLSYIIIVLQERHICLVVSLDLASH